MTDQIQKETEGVAVPFNNISVGAASRLRPLDQHTQEARSRIYAEIRAAQEDMQNYDAQDAAPPRQIILDHGL